MRALRQTGEMRPPQAGIRINLALGRFGRREVGAAYPISWAAGLTVLCMSPPALSITRRCLARPITGQPFPWRRVTYGDGKTCLSDGPHYGRLAPAPAPRKRRLPALGAASTRTSRLTCDEGDGWIISQPASQRSAMARGRSGPTSISVWSASQYHRFMAGSRSSSSYPGCSSGFLANAR